MSSPLTAKDAEFLSLLPKLDDWEKEVVIERLKKFNDTQITAPLTKNPLVEAITGRTFSQKEKLQLEIDSLFHYFQRRRQLVAGALTSSQVAQLLGTSRQTPHDRVKAKTLLGVQDKGMLWFPIWQFDPQGPDGVIDGLSEVLKTLQVSDFAKLNWLMRENSFLDNLTPVQMLKEGQKERVIQEATVVGSR